MIRSSRTRTLLCLIGSKSDEVIINKFWGSKVDNDKIKSLLKSAGLPKEVFATTLKNEGMEEVRQYILEKSYEQHPLVYIHPSSIKFEKSYEKAELCFYLLLKELILSSVQSFSCQLVDVHTALFKDTEEADDLTSRLDVQVLGISRFYDRGGRVAQFMTEYESHYFNSWLYRRVNSEKGTILFGAAPLSECDDWWPSSMLAFLRKNAVTFEIKG